MRSICRPFLILVSFFALAPAALADSGTYRLDADTDLIGISDRKSYDSGIVAEWLIQDGNQVNDAKLRLDLPWCSLEKMLLPRDPSEMSAGGPKSFEARPGSRPAAQQDSILSIRVQLGSGSDYYRLECHRVVTLEDVMQTVLKGRGRFRQSEAAQALADGGRKNLNESGVSGYVDFAAVPVKTYGANGASF